MTIPRLFHRRRKPPLKSLDEFNRERGEQMRRGDNQQDPNGIACPECGAELVDTYAIYMTTSTMMCPIHCPQCEWKGTRHR